MITNKYNDINNNQKNKNTNNNGDNDHNVSFSMTKTLIIMIMEEFGIITRVTVIKLTFRQETMEKKNKKEDEKTNK